MNNGIQTSRWVHYDGISLTDLKFGDDSTIEVLIPSLSPAAMDGPVAAGTTSVTTNFLDVNGNPQQANATTANHVRATWLGNDFEHYPPMVRKNEQVKIYQYGNSDKYFWTSYGRDSKLRTLDVKRIEVSATPVVGQTNVNDNTYYLEMNSVEGRVRLSTAKKNGEPFAYIIDLDTKNGIVSICDDKAGDNGPNKFYIDSNKNIIHISNNDGTTYHADGKDLIIQVPESFSIKAGKQIYFESPQYTFNKDSSGVMVNNVKYVTNNGFTSVNNYQTVGVNCTGMKITGSLVTGGIRSPSYANGPVGGAYSSSSTDVYNGTSGASDNSADTDVSGGGDRHTAAYEQVLAAFQATAEAITAVAIAAKTQVSVEGILSNAQQSLMNNIKGE